MKVEILTCPAGDWVEVRVDGTTFHAGHEVPRRTWAELLEQLGAEVAFRQVKNSFFSGDEADD